MKTLCQYLSLLGMFLFLTACDGTFFGFEDGDTISPADLADSITDYITDNYSGYNIEDVHVEDICDIMYYEVELEDGPGPDVELYFSIDEAFAFVATEISKDALPQAVLEAIAQNYADYTINDNDVERFDLPDGSLQFEVELEQVGSADLEVIFNADGSVFCQDDDDDNDDDSDDDDSDDDNSGDDDGSGDDDDNSNGMDDDDDNNSAQLTDDMKDYIKNNYPGYDIEEVEIEDICDDMKYYEVELEDGPGPDLDLYFTLDGVFAFTATEISKNELPQPVLDALDQNFSNYSIDDDDIQKFELADGSLQFEVELEGDGNNDLDEVVFNADGSVFCQD